MKPILYQPYDDILNSRPYFVLPREEDAVSYAECGGVPEKNLIEWALEFLDGPNPTLIDVGANVGTWSIPYALKGIDVLSFEPNPYIYRCLSAGFLVNGLLNKPVQMALGYDEGYATLRVPDEGWIYGGGGSMVSDHDGGTYTEHIVNINKLDNYMFYRTSHDQKTLVKMDVEGYELDVLKGGTKLINHLKPTILLEVWDEERGQRREELFDFIVNDLGYTTSKTSWPEMYVASPR